MYNNHCICLWENVFDRTFLDSSEDATEANMEQSPKLFIESKTIDYAQEFRKQNFAAMKNYIYSHKIFASILLVLILGYGYLIFKMATIIAISVEW